MAQNYKNHRRYVPGFHMVVSPLMLLCLIGAIVNLTNSFKDHGNLYSASLIVLMNIILALVAFFARSFALKAQDRAIRAEENLRHLVLTGKLHDPALTTGQLIALRFADNDEYVALAKKAVEHRLTNDQIKREIKNWKADHNRV